MTQQTPAAEAKLALDRYPLGEAVLVPIDLLRPSERNPRTITPERLTALRKAMRADPEHLLARPCICTPDGEILAGNMRWQAAMQEGLAEVPVFFTDRGDADARLLMLRDNAPYGEWENDALAELLDELRGFDADLELAGFRNEELEALLAQLGTDDRDEDAIPEPPKEPRSRLGEVYELGPHRLMCGDATNGEHVSELMGAERAACIFTDPPYGVAYTGGMKRRKQLAGDGRDTTIYEDSLPLMVGHAMRGAAFYVWYANLSMAATALADAGLTIRCQIVWVKNHAQFISRSHYHGKHESCIYAARLGDTPKWYGPKNEVTVWEHARAAQNDLHPTQKPVGLARRAVTNSTRAGELLLDPFAGAGSTLIAAEQMGRRCYAMEIEPRYCDVVRLRYARYVNQPE